VKETREYCPFYKAGDTFFIRQQCLDPATATPKQFCMHSLNDIYETSMNVRKGPVQNKATWVCTCLRIPLHVGGRFSTSGVPDHRLQRNGADRHGLLDQTVEQLPAVSRRSSVEAECILIKVVSKMFCTDGPLVRSQEPSLQQSCNLMAQRKQVIAYFGLLSYHLVDIANPTQPVVARPSIGTYRGTRLDGLFNGSHQAICRCVGYLAKPDAPDPFSIFLRDNDYQRFARCATSVLAWFLSANIGFIDLDHAREAVSTWPDHGPTQLVQPRPGCAVAPQAKNSLQADGVGSILLTRHMPDGSEPKLQRLLRILKDCPGRDRCLPTALRALVQAPADPRRFLTIASRTPKPLWPSQSRQVPTTRLLVAEALIEINERTRVVLHRGSLYVVAF